MTDLPALQPQFLAPPELTQLEPERRAVHSPRILLLYGSLRDRSFSRLLVEEAARILQRLGAETRVFDPRDLPLPDATAMASS
jgi:arsenic resistance protein ArsH